MVIQVITGKGRITIENMKKENEKQKETTTMLEKVKEIVAENLGADINTLTEETSFKDDLGADSLDLFEMVMALEEEYGKEIPTEDLEQLTTIGEVVDYLSK